MLLLIGCCLGIFFVRKDSCRQLVFFFLFFECSYICELQFVITNGVTASGQHAGSMLRFPTADFKDEFDHCMLSSALPTLDSCSAVRLSRKIHRKHFSSHLPMFANRRRVICTGSALLLARRLGKRATLSKKLLYNESEGSAAWSLQPF